jgi:murein DD-endopeptidase MepM/ murein hydrolase activator NlpD
VILAVVAVAGIGILLRGGHGPVTALHADAATTAPGYQYLLAAPGAGSPLAATTALTAAAAPVRAGQAASGGSHGVPSGQGAAPVAAERTTPTATATPVPPLDLEGGTLRGSSAASSPPPTPTPPTDRDCIVFYHEVQPGDTLSTIAARYGVSIDSILSINEVIQDKDVLKIGLQLFVPCKEGVVTFVKWGDTVSELAEKYGVKPEDIVNYKPNRLTDADSIREGELILIPGGKRPAPPPPPPPPPVQAATTASSPAGGRGAAPGRSEGAPAPAPAPAPATAAAARPAGGWIWPITGPISSYFGPSHPLGIDIDLYGRAGAPIVAARGGVVTFAGGNPCCSYGYYVEIDHGDGFRTLYAHLNAPPPVRIGQQVGQGQVIGYAGTTGYSTGVHLHFEIRRGGVPVNPLAYLP